MRNISKIIIHCAATPPDRDIGAAEIRQWHTLPEPQGNGWVDIGYHGVIRRDGTLDSGRPLDQVGAHTVGHNKSSIGICLIGGVSEDGKTPEANFTTAQWDSLRRVLHDLKSRYPDATIHGHNEFSPNACPAFNVQAWLASLGGAV